MTRGGRLNRVRPLAALRRLVRDKRGNVTMLAGLAVVPMMAGAGLVTDAGRAYMVDNRLSKALDSAALAAGRVLFAGSGEAEARAFFNANYPDDYLDSTVTDFTFTVGPDQQFITVTAEADVATTFMRVLGRQTITVTSRSVVERQNRGAEIALVMDNTGSMRSGGKMDAMKAAGQDLVEIMFGDANELNHLYVSVVPYTATINIGPHNWDWLKPGDKFHDSPSPYAPTSWRGCVEARTVNDRDETDDPPSVAGFTSFLYEANAIDNDWPDIKEENYHQNEGTGPNLGCGPAITPLTNQKDTVEAAVAEMQPWHRGGTTSNLGLVWGWRTLSPRWQGLWEQETPAGFPLAYDEELMDKVAIVLTDGVNQFYEWKDAAPGGSDDTAYGRLLDYMPSASDEDDVVPTLNTKFAEVCEDMKAKGIILYTVTFGSSASDPDLQDLYRGCASNPANYYHAPDNATLREAFRSIGDKLSNLRIVE
jgi:Flp pilus assembly protein TadG